MRVDWDTVTNPLSYSAYAVCMRQKKLSCHVLPRGSVPAREKHGAPPPQGGHRVFLERSHTTLGNTWHERREYMTNRDNQMRGRMLQARVRVLEAWPVVPQANRRTARLTDLLGDGRGHVLGDPLAEPLVHLHGRKATTDGAQTTKIYERKKYIHTETRKGERIRSANILAANQTHHSRTRARTAI